MNTKILMIEDEPGLVLGVGDRLQAEGYQFFSESNGLEGLNRAREENFDLLLLDIMLPGLQGFEVLRRLRTEKPILPVLMLTAKSQISDKVSGLRLGADDYLTKPFDMEELVARIETILRRSKISSEVSAIAEVVSPKNHSFGPFTLDTGNSQLFRGTDPVELSYQEYQLLKVFIEHRGQVLSGNSLLNLAWGYESEVTSRTLYVHIAWLRKKLKNPNSPQGYISTRRKIGYIFHG